jgi:hypothetical protein
MNRCGGIVHRDLPIMKLLHYKNLFQWAVSRSFQLAAKAAGGRSPTSFDLACFPTSFWTSSTGMSWWGIYACSNLVAGGTILLLMGCKYVILDRLQSVIVSGWDENFLLLSGLQRIHRACPFRYVGCGYNRSPVQKHTPHKSTGRSHSTPCILLIVKNQPLIILTWN